MHPLLESLTSAGPVVTDGAWGTQLQQRGLQPGDIPDLWNLTRGDDVREIARAYVEAGSQVILTNTFGANRIRLEEGGAGGQAAAINEAGARLSREAAGERAVVFASMGPSGKLLMAGDITEDDLLASFTEQAQALAAGGAQGIVVETMSDPAEAVLAVRAARGTGLPVVGCMVFDSGRDKDRTMMGTTPEDAAAAMADAGADVIGANCGQGVAGFITLCSRLKAAAQGRPIWIKANAGLPTLVEGAVTYATTAEAFADYVPALVEAGAGFVGGCCGTDPRFIRAVRARVDLLRAY